MVTAHRPASTLARMPRRSRVVTTWLDPTTADLLQKRVANSGQPTSRVIAQIIEHSDLGSPVLLERARPCTASSYMSKAAIERLDTAAATAGVTRSELMAAVIAAWSEGATASSTSRVDLCASDQASRAPGTGVAAAHGSQTRRSPGRGPVTIGCDQSLRLLRLGPP